MYLVFTQSTSIIFLDERHAVHIETIGKIWWSKCKNNSHLEHLSSLCPLLKAGLLEIITISMMSSWLYTCSLERHYVSNGIYGPLGTNSLGFFIKRVQKTLIKKQTFMTLLTDSPAVYPYSSTVPPWPPACSWLVRAFSSSIHRSSWPAFGPWQLLSGQQHLHTILVAFLFRGKSGEGY